MVEIDFYKQFKELVLAKPASAIWARACENVNFGDYHFRSKNMYLSYFTEESEDCLYSSYLSKSHDCVDCLYVTNGELVYESVDSSNLYDCAFLQDCHHCSRVQFSFDCINCKNCFGCFGLRQQEFCIFNKKYSEQEYYEKVQQFLKHPPQKIFEIMHEQFMKTPRLYAHLFKSGGNSLGDYLYRSNSCFFSYNMHSTSDAAYCQDFLSDAVSSSNVFEAGFCSNLNSCYDADSSFECTDCNFIKNCVACEESEYLINCYNCKNCFGCVYLENKQYCFLNKQLTREEYEFAINQIKGNLKSAGNYGKMLADVLL
ncbi:hypothetical protein KBD59_05435 [Candidatus Gracilibacteria bacterium]|nr:hypothetical protein [Candidatus Gracilibacteria bacterium]